MSAFEALTAAKWRGSETAGVYITVITHTAWLFVLLF